MDKQQLSEDQTKMTESFSYFKCPITNVLPLQSITLGETYELIKFDKFKENTELYRLNKDKKFKSNQFDYVTFNGTFSKREDGALINLSNFFILDIDHIANLDIVRERIIKDENLCPKLVFISPSGDGLKIVLSIDVSLVADTGNKRMLKIWSAINEYFRQNYSDILTANQKGEYIDASGTDLSRACFLCHDPEAYYNEEIIRIIDANFIEKYKIASVEISKKSIKPNIQTDINKLAIRHLLQDENHHNQLLPFTAACSSISLNRSTVKHYIEDFVQISADSSWNNNIDKKVDEIYDRYNDYDVGVKQINDTTICYKLYCLKYSNISKKYILTSLYMDGIRNFLQENGYSKRKVGNDVILIQKVNNIITEVTVEDIKTFMNTYINNITENTCFDYKGNFYEITSFAIREIYLRNSHNIFNDTWLQNLSLNDDKIIKDTKDTMFFYFQNCIIQVDKQYIDIKKWEEMDGCIWESQVIKWNYQYIESRVTINCKFAKFIDNLTNNDIDRFKSIMSALGYMMHFHFNESEGQAVILYDQTITDMKTPMGGSGKGLVVNALKQLRNVSKIDGKNFNNDNRFKWEAITPSTQIVWIDDVKNDFEFSTLHSNLTDGWSIERKFLSQFTLAPSMSPKTIICSNSIIKGNGSTNKRRQFIVEVSDYYSSKIKNGDEKPIEEEHGGLFFGADWDKNEWDCFYSYMLQCAKFYLTNGLVHAKPINVEINRFKQTTNEDFVEWCEEEKFELNETYNTKEKCTDYNNTYNGDKNNIAQRTFSNWLKEYAIFKNWKKNTKKSNGQSLFIFSK